MRRLGLLSAIAMIMVLALPAVAFAQDEPTIADLSLAVDTVWVVIAAVLVIFMQAGFAMLEVGFSRMKNVGSVVAKILVNLAIAALLFWAVGFAFAFGDGNALIGTQGFFLSATPDNVNDVFAGLAWTQVPLSAKYLFQVAFCRRFPGDCVGHDAGADQVRRVRNLRGCVRRFDLPDSRTLDLGWWLARQTWSMQDFAGSTVVHLSGAMAALAGTLILGPRIGKYDDDGNPQTIPGHNMPLAVLGVLILWVGWFGFNPGSTMAAVPDIADIALTTNLAAAAGVLGAMVMSYVRRGNVDVGMGGNGAIAALVAITAGCAFVAPWASVVIGFIAGIIMYATLEFVDKIGVDDPLGAIAAHGMGGIWGTLSLGLFTTSDLASVGQPGLLYGGGFTQLGVQAVGVIAAGGFVFISSLAVFAILKATIGLRVKPEQELNGLDISEHGVYGYAGQIIATDDRQNGNGQFAEGPKEKAPAEDVS